MKFRNKLIFAFLLEKCTMCTSCQICKVNMCYIKCKNDSHVLYGWRKPFIDETQVTSLS